MVFHLFKCLIILITCLICKADDTAITNTLATGTAVLKNETNAQLIAVVPQPSTPTDFWQRIQADNMATEQWCEEEWPTEPYYTTLKRTLAYQKNPQPFKRRRIAWKINNTDAAHAKEIWHVLEDKAAWKDLQLFSPQNYKGTYLAELIDRTVTSIGKVSLCCMLADPLVESKDLLHRQKVIKELLNDSCYSPLDEAFKSLALHEPLLISYDAQFDLFKEAVARLSLSDKWGVTLSSWANRNESVLLWAAINGHQERMLYVALTGMAAFFLTGYALAKGFNKPMSPHFEKKAQNYIGTAGPSFAFFADPFPQLKETRPRFHDCYQSYMFGAGGLICGLFMRHSIRWMRDNFFLFTCLQEKLIAVARYIETAQKIQMLVKSNAVLKEHIDVSAFDTFFNSNNPSVKKLLGILNTRTFKSDPSIVAHPGRILAAYNLMADVKAELEPVLRTLGQLDAYMSIARLYKEFETNRVTFCFVNYVTDAQPYIQADEFWNVFVDPTKVVSNSIELGRTHKHNIILTGPNGGGKSTIGIKALALTLILAQSFGIAPAKQLTMTPFHTITTYLNIADDIAAGNSLFKAQAVRAHTLVSTVESLKKENKRIFVAIDEMFNGTSNKEATAAAYSVAKHLGTYENAITIIATHFPELTALTEQYDNYKVTVAIADGKLSYPYKLEKGISDQHVALDMLRLEGFESSILDEANRLVHSVS